MRYYWYHAVVQLVSKACSEALKCNLTVPKSNGLHARLPDCTGMGSFGNADQGGVSAQWWRQFSGQLRNLGGRDEGLLGRFEVQLDRSGKADCKPKGSRKGLVVRLPSVQPWVSLKRQGDQGLVRNSENSFLVFWCCSVHVIVRYL